MSGFEDQLSEEQKEVVGLVKAIQPSLPTDHQAKASEFLDLIVESGIWSIGMAEELGGGGAEFDLRLAALLQLATTHPACAWAVAQAHAGSGVLSAGEQFAHLAKDIVDGTVAVCLVDQGSESVNLRVESGRLVGTLDRLDTVADPLQQAPYVIVLAGAAEALVIQPEALTNLQLVERTGFNALYSFRSAVDTPFDAASQVIGSVDNARTRTQLARQSAVIAAGIAHAAAGQSAEYAKNRVQFGASLMEIPMVRATSAAQQADAGTSLDAALASGPDTFVRAVSALDGNCERALSVTASALQSHGGYGFLKDFDIERLVRDALSLRAASGTLSLVRRVADNYQQSQEGHDVAFFAREVIPA